METICQCDLYETERLLTLALEGEYLLSKMLGTRIGLGLGVSQILKYLHRLYWLSVSSWKTPNPPKPELFFKLQIGGQRVLDLEYFRCSAYSFNSPAFSFV